MPRFASPFGRNRLDLTGQTIGGALVLRAAFNALKVQRFWIRCACGEECMRATNYLRTAEKNGTPVLCDTCAARHKNDATAARRKQREAAGLTPEPRRCGRCNDEGHYAKSCPLRPPRRCEDCEGMPWRRPIGSRRLCSCGEPYAAEPVVTLDDIERQARVDRRAAP